MSARGASARDHELREHVDGAWRAPALPLPDWICDASDGTRLVAQRASDAGSLERALAAAARAHEDGVWSEVPAAERAQVLREIAGHLEAEVAEIADLDARTTGVVCTQTRLLAQVVPRCFATAAEVLLQRAGPTLLPGAHGPVEVHRLPLGPAAVIAPWNAPAAIAAHKLASALAAGCPVVLKPSEWAPHSAQAIGRAIVAAGLPRGVFQLVHGGAGVGDALVADPRVAAVSFTGGLAGGRAVAARCAHALRPVQLELGGNNPLVVLASADLDAAANGVVAGLTTLNGQWCRALGRVLVDRRVSAELLERVLERLAALRVGHALDAASELGPQAHARQREAVRRALAELAAAGATLLAPSRLPAELAGWFVAPTIAIGADAARARDEIFGPVATWHTFERAGEALALARDTGHGLAAYVFGEEGEAFALGRKLHVGSVKVNAVTVLGLHPLAPRAAWGLSGLGDEGAVETFELFRGTRVVGAAAGALAATSGSR